MHITLDDLIKFIVAIGGAGAVIAGIVKWVNSKLKDIVKLNRVVFDENGFERYVTRFKFDEANDKILAKLDALIEAVNHISESQIVQLDVQVETCDKPDLRKRLMQEKEKLNKQRGIV